MQIISRLDNIFTYTMKILSWNYQGLGSKWTISFLREIQFKHKPAFLFLSETKQQFDFVQKFHTHFGNTHLHTVDPVGRMEVLL